MPQSYSFSLYGVPSRACTFEEETSAGASARRKSCGKYMQKARAGLAALSSLVCRQRVISAYAPSKRACGRALSFLARPQALHSFPSGPGGSRTLVQTGKQQAFYTLIAALVFVCWQDRRHQPTPYPLKFHRGSRACRGYSRITCTALSRSLGTTALGRCLVPAPCAGIKPTY